MIEAAGLTWSVVESVPVHEDIKKRSGNVDACIRNYQETLRNLAACGIYTVCYNFMPILDWTRTDLHYALPNGAKALRYDVSTFAFFDRYILKREGAETDYSTDILQKATEMDNSVGQEEREKLTDTIIAGLPGGHEGYSLDAFRAMLAEYDGISEDQLRKHLILFLEEILPVAEEHGIKLCIHPDDPPYPLMGLPRVVSTSADLEALMNSVPSPSNGITFCTGSLGARNDNDLPEMAAQFADKIHFLHFRSVYLEKDGSFFEDDHLRGNSNIAGVMNTLIQSDKLPAEHVIPFRPDHGHQMLDDLNRNTNPGYSCIGRMKGLAQLRGLEQGLRVATGKSV